MKLSLFVHTKPFSIHKKKYHYKINVFNVVQKNEKKNSI